MSETVLIRGHNEWLIEKKHGKLSVYILIPVTPSYTCSSEYHLFIKLVQKLISSSIFFKSLFAERVLNVCYQQYIHVHTFWSMPLLSMRIIDNNMGKTTRAVDHTINGVNDSMVADILSNLPVNPRLLCCWKDFLLFFDSGTLTTKQKNEKGFSLPEKTRITYLFARLFQPKMLEIHTFRFKPSETFLSDSTFQLRVLSLIWQKL